jgi:hypothetical protein
MSDPSRFIKFLIGVVWSGVVFWYFANRAYGRGDFFDWAMMLTSGGFGWIPFALDEGPKTVTIFGLFCQFFVAIVVIIIGLIVEPLIMGWPPPNTPLGTLRIVLATVIPWSLIGIGWYVWRKIRTVK